MTPISGLTWRSRARTTAWTSKAWPWTATGCCSACAARCCAAGRRCSRLRSRPTAISLRLVPLDDSGTLLRKHFLQLDGLGIRDLHFSGDDLYILAGPTMVLNGEIRVFKWPTARSLLAANREPVRFESALTDSVSLPHRRGTNRAEAICDLPPALVGRQGRAGSSCTTRRTPIAKRGSTPSLETCCAAIEIVRVALPRQGQSIFWRRTDARETATKAFIDALGEPFGRQLARELRALQIDARHDRARQRALVQLLGISEDALM